MPFRFTILPGVRLDLSTSGVSLSVGPQGLVSNSGKRGWPRRARLLFESQASVEVWCLHASAQATRR